MRRDPVDVATQKCKDGKLMTLKEWQLTVFDRSPSSLWHDFFPLFIRKNGIPLEAKLSPAVWSTVWDLAGAAHKEKLDALVAANPPTLSWRGMTYGL